MPLAPIAAIASGLLVIFLYSTPPQLVGGSRQPSLLPPLAKAVEGL
jgi:hypothetical protein